ncbi:MAG: signal peptidase I [Candidatus Korarchaeota archaeon]|nr:signal peptidase I [Thermoproteota archaeon]
MPKERTLKILTLLITFGILAIFIYQIHEQYMISYIKSGSMEPTYNRGDLVIIKRVDPKEISVGDVIVFRDPRDPSVLILHRVVAVKEHDSVRYFLTKGDNPDTNPCVDVWGWVREDNVIGILVARVQFLGYIFLMFDEPSARFLLILLGTLVILTYIAKGFEEHMQIAPVLQYLKNRRVVIICMALLLSIVLLLLVHSHVSGRGYWSVTVVSKSLYKIESDYYITLKLNITSKISSMESISKIYIQVSYGNVTIGLGSWSIIYPFYGTKIVSIAILLSSQVENLEDISTSISVVIFNYLQGSSIEVPAQ